MNRSTSTGNSTRKNSTETRASAQNTYWIDFGSAVPVLCSKMRTSYGLWLHSVAVRTRNLTIEKYHLVSKIVVNSLSLFSLPPSVRKNCNIHSVCRSVMAISSQFRAQTLNLFLFGYTVVLLEKWSIKMTKEQFPRLETISLGLQISEWTNFRSLVA